MRILLTFLVMGGFSFAGEIAPIEQTMIDLINAEREALGRPFLKADANLSKVARLHSYAMVKERFFSHKNAKSGSPMDRVRLARIPVKKVYEHITRATSPVKAHARLMDDKNYQTSVVDREYENVGVGMYSPDEENYHVTIILSVPIELEDTPDVISKFITGVNADRRAGKLPEIIVSKKATEIAMDACRHMNKIGALLVGDTIKAGMKNSGLAYRNYRSKYWFIRDIETAREASLLKEAKYTRIGLGVLPNDNKKRGFGTLWVVMILFEPR